MNALVNAALDRPRTVMLTLLLLLLVGVSVYIAIPKESDPDINIPIIYVSMHHEGMSPDDAVSLLIKPMEQELRGIEHVTEVRSTAYEGGANVTLEFEAGFDADTALEDVRARVDIAKTGLPDDTDDPTVNEINLSLFPVLVVSLSGNVPERTMLRLARTLKDNIEGVSEVLEAVIKGDREEVIEVIVDPVILESYRLNVLEIARNVSQSNRPVTAGLMDTGAGQFAVKVPGLIADVDDFLGLPLKIEGDATANVGEIAEVRRTFKDARVHARVKGEPALTIEVSKRTGENIIETIEKVRAVVEATSAGWPPGVKVAFSRDESKGIRLMLADLQNNVMTAVLLVMVVIVWCLGWRSAALVGVAIPGSFLTGILVLAIAGLTLNIVVLFSLILAVGMLVDGAIVVTEYADRKMAEGLNRREAYFAAASRMAWPITASTLTTLVAFFPLMFWTGMVGEFMKYLPITLIAVLSASLAMALIFVPTLGSLFGKNTGRDSAQARALSEDSGGSLDGVRGFTGLYLGVLRVLLRHPVKVLLVSVLLLAGVQIAYARYGKGVEFFPDIEPERAAFQIHARGNLSTAEKDGLVREVEDRLLDMNEFETIFAAAGGREDNRAAEDVIGTVNVELVDWSLRRPASAIFEDVLARVTDLAGIHVESRGQRQGPRSAKPIKIQVSSSDPVLLERAVAALRDHLDEVEGLKDIEDSRPIPGIQWEIVVDRNQAAKFGADVGSVGAMIQLVTRGLRMTTVRLDDSNDEIDVLARFPHDMRTLDGLDHLRVETPLGHVPISNFVERSARPRVGRIERVEGERVMTIEADIEEGVLADSLVRDLQAWLDTVELGRGIDVDFRGDNERQEEASEFLLKAFLVALFMMAIILVTQFNSFYSAFLILTAVIMSTVGVMIGLLVTGKPYGMIMSSIGVISLAGIVVNNNIVLIDTYDRLRRMIADPVEAILRTGAQRLRPVLLTMVTTILGLMPMMLQINIDFFTRDVSVGAPSTQWWVQLASAIVFGLAFATVLTLIVTPCALMVRENVGSWRQVRKARRSGRADMPLEAAR